MTGHLVRLGFCSTEYLRYALLLSEQRDSAQYRACEELSLRGLSRSASVNHSELSKAASEEVLARTQKTIQPFHHQVSLAITKRTVPTEVSCCQTCRNCDRELQVEFIVKFPQVHALTRSHHTVFFHEFRRYPLTFVIFIMADVQERLRKLGAVAQTGM